MHGMCCFKAECNSCLLLLWFLDRTTSTATAILFISHPGILQDCGVWQHCDCVRVNVLTTTCAHFLCELCRLAKADPFWRRLGQPLVPAMKLCPVQPPRMSFDGRPIEEDVVQVS